MSQVNTTANRFVSPIVSSYTPGAYINVDSELTETVTVSNINETFKYELSGTDLTAFLSGIAVSGVNVDTRLGKIDPNIADLSVTMGTVAATKDAFKAVLDKIIGNAEAVTQPVMDAGGGNEPDKKVASYLHAQLYNAFITAFAANLPSSNIEANDEIVGSSTSTLNTSINSFNVYVDMDASAAAAAMITQHTGEDALKSLFRQIPVSTLKKFLPADESQSNGLAVGAEQELSTSSLPVLSGDKLVFVFDIDVKAAGENTGGNTGTAVGGEEIPADTNGDAVPVAPAQGDSPLFTLDLANRRVAFEITLSSGSVGTPIEIA